MMCLIFVAKPLEYQHRIGFVRLTDRDRLKSPLKCRIFFDVSTILLYGSSADYLNLAARQHRLYHICCVKRVVASRSGTYERVYLVNEQDHISVRRRFVDHALDTFLKITAILAAGKH